MTHFPVLVILPQPEGPRGLEAAVAALLDPYDEDTSVEPYKAYFEPEAITRMADAYSIDPTDLPALVAKMKDWCGHGGGIEEDGRLYQWSVYNPKSRWDWWVIGGRWSNSGFWPETPSADAGLIEQIKLDDPLNDLVTPDGEWHESGRHGWWGIYEPKTGEDEWRAKFYEILSGFRTHVAVLVDCHI